MKLILINIHLNSEPQMARDILRGETFRAEKAILLGVVKLQIFISIHLLAVTRIIQHVHTPIYIPVR